MFSRAADLIRDLALVPHPEGGHYREIHRASLVVQPADTRGPRQALTTIYFLLAAGEHSRWHQVQSDEVWQFHEGDPLELIVAPPEFDRITHVDLGPVGQTTRPIHVVPAGWWQAARPRGHYTLVGCTVAPGFEFADFAFLRDAPDLVSRVAAIDPSLVAFV